MTQDNIKNIFQAQYGLSTDFDGYLDKFYSTEIYRFDNRKNILSILDEITNRVQILHPSSSSNEIHPDIQKIATDLKSLLYPLIQNGQISLRSLLKYYGSEIALPKDKILFPGFAISVSNNSVLASLFWLSSMLGDLTILKSKINKLETLHVKEGRHLNTIVGDLVMIQSSKNLHKILNSGKQGVLESAIKFEHKFENQSYRGTFAVYGPENGKLLYSSYINEIKINDLDHIIDIDSMDILPLLKRALPFINF